MTDEIDFSARDPVHADELFYERWSPRSFKQCVLEGNKLKKILDAARWAPSCSNEQPWTIYTAGRQASSFKFFVECLTEGNRVWAKDASILGFFIARLNFSKKPKANTLCEFDCGASWMSLSLQARIEGLYTHGMGGIYRDKVADFLNLDTSLEKVVMGFALGYLEDRENLRNDLRDREKPSSRKDLKDIWEILD